MRRLHALVLIAAFVACHVYAAHQPNGPEITEPTRVDLDLDTGDQNGSYNLAAGVDMLFIEHGSPIGTMTYNVYMPAASTASDVVTIITDRDHASYGIDLVIHVQTGEYLNATLNGTETVTADGAGGLDGEATFLCPFDGGWSICHNDATFDW